MTQMDAAPDKTDGGLFTFVTIVFRGDIALLRLQAQSMARFIDPDTVSSILLVLNDVDEPGLRGMIADLLDSYGPLRSKLRIVSGDDLLLRPDRKHKKTLFERIYVENRFRIPFVGRGGWRGGNGYRFQQALKLASARAATSENMVILDGKNIFLRAPDPYELFGRDGRAIGTFAKVVPDFHRNWLAESLDVLSVQVPLQDIQETVGYSTPYSVKRKLLLNLLDEIEAGYGSVQALFASKRRPSEFMLIHVFCLKHFGGPDRMFANCGRRNIGIWGDFDAAQVDAVLAEAEAQTPLTFGLHRKAVANLNPGQRQKVQGLFEAKGLDAARVLTVV